MQLWRYNARLSNMTLKLQRSPPDDAQIRKVDSSLSRPATAENDLETTDDDVRGMSCCPLTADVLSSWQRSEEWNHAIQ